MIDEQLIQQLSDFDPQRRKQAITALAKTKDPAALKHLQQVFKTDSDPEVRELARKAGLYIYKNAAPGAAAAPVRTPPPAPEAKPATADWIQDLAPEISVYDSAVEPDQGAEETFVPLPPKRKDVSGNDKIKAQGLLEQAAELHMRDENQKAAELLNRAFNLNPDLMEQNYARGIAASITGLPADEAVHHLVISQRKQAPEKAKVKRSAGSVTSDNLTWGGAVIDLAIYGVAVGGLTFVAMLVALQIAGGVARMMESGMGEYGYPPSPFGNFSAFLMTAGVVAILGVSLAAGVGSVIALLVQYGAIHLSATRILDGRGTLLLLIRKLTLFLTLTYPVSYAAPLVGTVLIVAKPDLANLVFLGTVAFTLAVLGFMSQRIGDVYQFGAFKGCGAIILSVILLSIIGVVCGCLFSTLMAGALVSSIPAEYRY